MEKKATLKDIAKAAGVSVATVSYIINDKSDQKISEQTKKKVLQIANLLNYTPSYAAKSLATGRNNIIGVSYRLNPNTPSRNLDILNFVNLLTERLNRLKYDILLMPFRMVEDNIPVNSNIDGIITIDLSCDEFRKLSDNYMVPIINIDMLVNDSLFYQIYSDIPGILTILVPDTPAWEDTYFVLERFDNECYMDFITSSVPPEHVIIASDNLSYNYNLLNGKNVIVLGTYLSMLIKPYLPDSLMKVIIPNNLENILPDEISTIENDVAKKANVSISILLNAIDRKFDIKHDHKIL